MGKSQMRRLREATERFGRENYGRWYSARVTLSILALLRKKEAGLIAPTAIRPVSIGPVLIQRYSTSLTYQGNIDKFGRSRHEDFKHNA